MKLLKSVLLTMALAFVAAQARSATILPPDAFWNVTGSVNGFFQAPFGDYSPVSPSPNTDWPPNTTLDLITTVNLSGYDLSTVQYQIAIDNDYTLFVNGTKIGSLVHDGNASWGAWINL